MITCTLRDKKYSIDFVSGRALRELEPAAQMYAKVVRLSELAAKGQPIPDDADRADQHIQIRISDEAGQRAAFAEGRARSGRAVYGHRGRIGARGRDQNR